MLLNIIGIIALIIIVSMIIKNNSFRSIIVVLFLSSLTLFIVRLTVENESILNAFVDSFGLLSLIAFIGVAIKFFRDRSVPNQNG
ncbi:hypothetical protein [Oceanobacillus sp. J11TS1]|uniref:hypothetical protein n=1 Tax=Oceanobacillus sp. J11TS1 TaxID=2807191 RepID=UPI001B15223A|nr:hypothetical protein [Oceanobacillus sp. J11TS1]GIO25235.1 hypothetical protein J11TS1_38160 [Oceanobacillus sp. J11TS1]